jgi:YegS/Rv2252/BmrU family lipid kinase
LPLAQIPRILIIYNPVSGRRRRGFLEQVLIRLRAGGCIAEVLPTEKRGDAERMAAAASPNYFDAIAVAGGDGTINEVLNGLARSPLPLGLIPMGTANVLAAEIGLEVTPDAVARTLLEGRCKRIDVGMADGRRFVMMAGVGFDADVVKGINSKLKRAVGKGAYVWQSLVEMLRYRPQTFRLTVDGVEHTAASAVFANGHFYAGRFTCAPEARLTDGRLHVCLFKASGRLSIVRYGAALMLGYLHRRRDIEILPATHVAIAGGEGRPVHGDGDILATLPLDVRMDEKGLELIVPVSFEPD